MVCVGGCNTYRVGFDVSKVRCFVMTAKCCSYGYGFTLTCERSGSLGQEYQGGFGMWRIC